MTSSRLSMPKPDLPSFKVYEGIVTLLLSNENQSGGEGKLCDFDLR